MSGKRYIEGNTSEHTDTRCNLRAADALPSHLGQGQEVQNKVNQQPSQCFDFLNPLPVKKDDPDTYPPIVTIDGRVDTDIDHLIDDIESEYNGPVEEIPSKFPKPHVFSVIDGSLDDDVDNYVNDDGTMEHTLVDAPKHFNPIELKDVASKESNNRKSLGQVKGGTSDLPLTNRSYNKTNTEHSENDISNDNMDAELSITAASQENSHMDHEPDDIADPSNSNMLVISDCSHKLVEVKRVESEERLGAEKTQTKSAASEGKSKEIKDFAVLASTANQHCAEVSSQNGIENSNIDLSAPKSVKEVANVEIIESSVIKADDKPSSNADDKPSSKADDKQSSKADDKSSSKFLVASKVEAGKGLAIPSDMGDSVPPPVAESSKIETNKNVKEVPKVQHVDIKCDAQQELELEVDDLSQYEDIDFSLNKSPELEAWSYGKAVSNSINNQIKESRTPSIRGRKDASPQISDKMRSNRIELAESPGHKLEGSKRQSNKDLIKANPCADDSSSISSCFMKDSRCFDDKRSPVTSRIAPSPLAKEREKSEKEVKAPTKSARGEVNSKLQDEYGGDREDSLGIDDDDDSESMELILQLEEIKSDKHKSKELLNQIKLFLMESNVKEKPPVSKASKVKQQVREPVAVKVPDGDETSAQEDHLKNSDKEDSMTHIDRSQDNLPEFPQVITQDEYYRKLYEQKGDYNTRVESSHLRKEPQSRRKRTKEEEKPKKTENDVPKISNVQSGRIMGEQEDKNKEETRSKKSRQQIHDTSMREDKDNTLADVRSYEDDTRTHEEETIRGDKKRRGGQQSEEQNRPERKLKDVAEQNIEKTDQVSSERHIIRKVIKKTEKAKEAETNVKTKNAFEKESSTLRKLKELTEWYTSERVPVKYIEPKGGLSAIDDAMLQNGPKRIVRSANGSELFAPYYFERERARKARTVAAIKQLVDVNGESSGDGEALARTFYKSSSPVHVKARRVYESVSAVSLASSQIMSEDMRVNRKSILPYELEQLLAYAQRKKSKPSDEYERNYIDDLIDSLKIRKPYSKEAQRSVKKSLKTALKIAEESVSAAAKVAQALSCVMQATKPREVTDSSSDEMITRTERKDISKKSSMTNYKRSRRSHSVSPLKRRALSTEAPRKSGRPSPQNDVIVAHVNRYEQEPIVHTRRIRALSMQPSSYKDTSPLAQQKPVGKGRSSPSTKVKSSPSSKERPSPTRERKEKEKNPPNEVTKKQTSSQRPDTEAGTALGPVPAPVPTAVSKASQATLDNYQQCNIVASNSVSRPKEHRYRGKSESQGRESQHKPRNRSVESYVGPQYISKHEKAGNPPCDQDIPHPRERECVVQSKERECNTMNPHHQHKNQTKHVEDVHTDDSQGKRYDHVKVQTKNVEDTHQETGQRKQLDHMRGPQRASEENHPEVVQHKRSEQVKSQMKSTDHGEGVQHKRSEQTKSQVKSTDHSEGVHHKHPRSKVETVDDLHHEKVHHKRPDHVKDTNKLVEGIHSDIDHLKRYMLIHNEIDHLLTPETPAQARAPSEKLTKPEQKPPIKHHVLPVEVHRNHPAEEPRKLLDPRPMKGKDETLMEGFPLESGDDTWSIPPKSYNANRKTESYFTQVILPKPVTDSKSSKLLLRRQMQGSRVDSFADDGSDTSLEYNSNFNRTLQQISNSGYKPHFMHDSSILKDCSEWQDCPVGNLIESMEGGQLHHTYYRETSQALVEHERCYTLEDRSKSSSRKSRSRPGSQVPEDPGQRRYHGADDENRDFRQSTSYRGHSESLQKHTRSQSYKSLSQITQEEFLGSPAKPSQHRNISSSHKSTQPVFDSPESPAPKLAVLKQNILKCQVPFPDRKKDNVHRVLKEGSKPMFSPIFEEASDKKYNSTSETDDLQSVEDEMWDHRGYENFNNGNIYGRSPSNDDLDGDSVDGSQFGHPPALRVEEEDEDEEEYTLNDSASGSDLIKDIDEKDDGRENGPDQEGPNEFSEEEGEERRSERVEESEINDVGEEDVQSSDQLESQEGRKSEDLISSTFFSEQAPESHEQSEKPPDDEARTEIGEEETTESKSLHSPSSQVDIKYSQSRENGGQHTPGNQKPTANDPKALERSLSPQSKPVPLGEQTCVRRQVSMDKYLNKIKQETKPVNTSRKPRKSDERLCSRLAEISRGPSRLDNWLRKSQSASVANQALNRLIGQEAILRENLLIVKRLINQETQYSREMQLKDYEQKLPLLRSFSRFPEGIGQRYGMNTHTENQMSAKANLLAKEQAQAIDEYFNRGRPQLKRSLSLPPIRKRSSSSSLRRIESSYSRDIMEKDFQEHYKKMLTSSRFSADWSKWMPVKLKINLSNKQEETDRKVKLATQRIDEMIRNKQPPYAPKQRSRT